MSTKEKLEIVKLEIDALIENREFLMQELRLEEENEMVLNSIATAPLTLRFELEDERSLYYTFSTD